MKAVFFPARDEVTTGELPDPVPGPGEVLLRVRASGICHTDIEVKKGNYGTGTYPLVPGHEYAGEVLETGDGVTGLTTGDRVVVDPNLECGTCKACKRGWAHLCESLGAYGVTTDGGFGELSVVRADRLHQIGDMPFEMAALAEPLGCVLNGLRPVKGRIIERAAVFGAGPIGMLMGLALKARGVAEVNMVDLDESRLDLAEAQGLTGIAAGSASLEALSLSCDLAADATGVAAVVQSLTGYVANGGAALLFGVCSPDARVEVSPFEIFRRELTLYGTHSLNHNIPEALAVISDIGPSIQKVVTHRLDMPGIAEVMATHAPAGSMKVQYQT
jgi:threonine dehydrogenase-like Zn-dependent dehydrogenase